MNIKPLSTLTLLIVLLKVNIGIVALAVLADVYACVEYSKIAPGVDANETLLPSDILNALVGLIQFLLAIFLCVTFLRWIYRVNKNLHVLSSEQMTFSPAWSVGWYFIPIAGFFKPYQAMKEIWTVAHGRAPSGSTILGWWWFLWIVSMFLGRIAVKLALRAQDAPSYMRSAVAEVASDGLDIVLNVVALMLVTAIARAYRQNYVEPGASNAGTTPAGNSNVMEEPPSVG